ncbi:4-coumarate--CoA ligase 1, partial [Eumeta japonica]
MLRNPKYLYGESDIKIPVEQNYGAFVLNKLTSFGDKTAFINGETDESVTHRTLAQRAVNLAISLARMGVGKGDTVALCSENRTEFWSTVVGVVCAGAVLSTINMGYTKGAIPSSKMKIDNFWRNVVQVFYQLSDELTHVMGIGQPKYIFCSPLAYQTHAKNFQSLRYIKKIIVFGEETLPNTTPFEDLVKENVDLNEFQPVDVEGQDTVMMLYSSGTTGLPKGVMITHYNCLVSAAELGFDTDAPDLTQLTITPWYHTMGLMATLHSMSAGITNVYLTHFELKLYLNCIQKYKPVGKIGPGTFRVEGDALTLTSKCKQYFPKLTAVLILVPPVMVLLAKTELIDGYDVSSVFVIYCGAAPLDLDTINAVKKKFPNMLAVLQGYGMTETTLAVTRDSLNLDNPSEFKPEASAWSPRGLSS